MPRILDGVKVGDWLSIVANGKQSCERVKRVSGLVVETDNYRFTKYGRTWPTHRPSIMAEPASKSEVQRWLEKQ